MKRLSSQLCNLESRMREEAAMDYQKKLQHDAELKIKASKRIKIGDSGEKFYTLDSLPANMLHLGGENFVCIVFFLGHTRVHVRKFISDQEGFLHPTKNGVSISPSVWHSFEKKSFNFNDHFLIVDKDLCVSRETKDESNLYVLQRMFQRKSLSFEFLPESVILTGAQIVNMQGLFPAIADKIKECLIQQTFASFISYEHLHCEKTAGSSNSLNIYCDFHDFANLTNSLTKFLTGAVTAKITELFDCFACKSNYSKSDMHACIMQPPSEKLESYFELAFYRLDWRQLAKQFYHENMYDFSIVPIDDFFSSLDVSDVISDVKKLYIDHEENVINFGE